MGYSAFSINEIEIVVNRDLSLISQWGITWFVDYNPIMTEATLFSFTNRKRDLSRVSPE
jgi:hypothetical protein